MSDAPNAPANHLYLVDGSSYIFRAYHRLPPLTNRHGMNVGAVYGYTTMLWKLADGLNKADGPTHMAVILDASESTFRNQMYAGYKAQRPPPPEDLVPQFPLIRTATRAFSIPCIEEEGLEADDIIACYVTAAKLAGWKVTIVSSDKDLMQLIDGDRVDMLGPLGRPFEMDPRTRHVLLVAGGLGFLLKTFVRGREKSDAPFLLTRADRTVAFLTGLGGGFIVGLTSVGSGTFFGLVMLLVFPLTAAKVVGTDIFHAAALLWVAGASHLIAGNVDLGATAWLLVGSVPGVLMGSQVTVKLPDRLLRVGLATVLTLSGVKLLEAPAVVVAMVLAAGMSLVTLVALRAPRGTPQPDSVT